MPSFDIVSETDMQEVNNAINSTLREIKQRFDFKGSKSTIEQAENDIIILADDNTKLKAIIEMIKVHFTKRKISPKALEFEKIEDASGNMLRQNIKIKQGINQEIGKKITKEIKSAKIKVQVSIRGEELRVTGKKRDDLQEVIAFVKELPIELPLQYINFRD